VFCLSLRLSLSLSVCFFGLFLLPVRCKYFAGRSSASAAVAASVGVDAGVNCSRELRIASVILWSVAIVVAAFIIVTTAVSHFLFCYRIYCCCDGRSRKIHPRINVVFSKELYGFVVFFKFKLYLLILLVLCLAKFRIRWYYLFLVVNLFL